jgi:hypothetical protein
MPTQSANWFKFCKEPCKSLLKCGHECALPCHSPTNGGHNAKCNMPLVNPCRYHFSTPLYCHDVEMSDAYKSIDEALEHHKCKVNVVYNRPECEHAVNVYCYQNQLLVTKKVEFTKDCVEIVEDFIHPKCNHATTKPKCIDKRNWEISPPNCVREVNYKRPCNCEKKMYCYAKLEELESPVICTEAVTIKRPRCSHELSLRCNVALRLQKKMEK